MKIPPKIWKVAVVIIAIGALTELISRRSDDNKRINIPLRDSLTCYMLLDKGKFNYDGLYIGFNYELLKRFAEGKGIKMAILPYDRNIDCWEKMKTGEYDIVVADSRKDTPANGDSLGFDFSLNSVGNNSWVVRSDDNPLKESAKMWLFHEKTSKEYAHLKERFFRSYPVTIADKNGKVGFLSPYDGLFKEYGKIYGIDWRLLTAIAHQESKFTIGAVSPMNAIGLMQLRRHTARQLGVTNLFDPSENIKAGTKCIKSMMRHFEKEDLPEEEILNFALASYNAGLGSVKNLRHLADSLGYDNTRWDDVINSLDSINGSHGGQTRQFVIKVLDEYEMYKKLTEK